jgi:hypothetical protein
MKGRQIMKLSRRLPYTEGFWFDAVHHSGSWNAEVLLQRTVQPRVLSEALSRFEHDEDNIAAVRSPEPVDMFGFYQYLKHQQREALQKRVENVMVRVPGGPGTGVA